MNAEPSEEYWGRSVEAEGSVPMLPTSSRHQSCAVCGASEPEWLHPLDPARVVFRVFRESYTLPNFWTLCTICEDVYSNRDHSVLLIRMRGNWTQDGDEELAEASLIAFGKADLGARSLPG